MKSLPKPEWMKTLDHSLFNGFGVYLSGSSMSKAVFCNIHKKTSFTWLQISGDIAIFG